MRRGRWPALALGLVSMALLALVLRGRPASDVVSVGLPDTAVWQVGVNTLVVERVEIRQRVWTGRVDPPPKLLQPVVNRFPALRQSWERTHREYSPGPEGRLTVSVEVRAFGPNLQKVLLSNPEWRVVTPAGPVRSNHGRWTIPGDQAELIVFMEVEPGTELQALEARYADQWFRLPLQPVTAQL